VVLRKQDVDLVTWFQVVLVESSWFLLSTLHPTPFPTTCSTSDAKKQLHRGEAVQTVPHHEGQTPATKLR
jgi:hypothetical protein